MTLRYLPNLISVVRLLLVAPVIWLLVREYYGMALLVFALAGVSDGLDGFLAKRYGWTTRVGGVLDAIADKVLLVSAFVTLGWTGLIPFWLVVAVVARDVVIVVGAAAYQLTIEPIMPAPTFLSKLNTVLQILLVLVVMWDQALSVVSDAWMDRFVYTVLATTVLSGLDYAWNWGWQAWRRTKGGSSDE